MSITDDAASAVTLGAVRRKVFARRLRVPLRGSNGSAELRRVRVQTVAILGMWHVPELADTACLIVDELLANAIRHAPTTDTASVGLSLDGGGLLRIGVSDRSAEFPRMRVAGTWDDDGRGLQLVASLASEWGAHRTPAGKIVYAVLRVPNPPIFDEVRRGFNGTQVAIFASTAGSMSANLTSP